MTGPNDADIHHDRAVALARQGKLEEAISVFHRALELRPNAAGTLRNLAIALAQVGRQKDAEANFRRAVDLDPTSAQCRRDWANSLRLIGKLDEAAAQYREVVRLREQAVATRPHPGPLPEGEGALAEAYHDLALVLSDLKRSKDAEEAYREALRLRPDFPEAYNNLGILLENQGKFEQAVEAYREALRIKPSAADVYNNLGVALAAQRKYEDAVANYRQALALTPDSPLALNNLGNSLRALGQIDEALRCLRQAIRLKPDYAEAYNNLGIALVQQRQDEEAVINYEKALYFRPDYPEAHLNRALAWLARGDLEHGWTEYEWRWKAKDINCRTFRQRRWDGGDLHGRTIFIYLEQGLGDTLQFIRYVRLLKQRGARVVLEVQKSLIRLVKSCPYIDAVIPVGSPLPEFDLQAPLLSLPGILGTTIDSIPADVPYLFADAGLIAQWREQLRLEAETNSPKSKIQNPKLLVGIAWQGNPHYRGDRQRSVPLRCFAPLAAIPGVQLVSLQKGFGGEQLAELAEKFPVTDLGRIDEEAGAFMDTAAIMKNLDLVITSDTAMPHLAGALAVPVWMALPRAADWRWMREGECSPWYPTMRMFRQREADDWDELFGRIADALRQQAAARRASPPKEKLAASDRQAEMEHQAALTLAKEGRLEEAQYRLRKAVELNPQLTAAHHNLGVILARQKRLEPAVRAFLKTLEIDPHYVDAYGNLGLAYFEQGRIDEAVAHFRKGLRLAPGSAETFNNLGVALVQQGKPQEAADCYRHSLQIKPDYVEAHVNLGRALLAQGNFARGWLEHEWREKLPGDRSRRSAKPRWNGTPLAGSTILLYAEQGLGDTLQFVRYADLVKQGGGTVVLECQSALTRILSNCPSVDKVIASGDTRPRHDVQAGLLSLPALLRTRTTNVPAEVPYLFADRKLAEKWKARLAKIEGLKVGIAWQGNPAWVGDRYRSLPLAYFQVLAELPDVRLVSLQKGSGAEQLVTAADHFPVVDFGPQVDVSAGAFMDTAAIVQGLDLVVTSDTSIAHLAGALGIPVWVALSYAPDWRWMTDRDDSPWYPTMRLFRQPRPGDWKSVFSNIAEALRKRRRSVARGGLPVITDNEQAAADGGRNRPSPVTLPREPRSKAGEGAQRSKSLNLTCPINKLGYGVVGASILTALVRAGVSVACWPMGRIDVQPDDRSIVEAAIHRQVTFDSKAPSLRIAHQDQLAQHVGFPRIGFPIFELNRFTERELHNLRSQDMLFVASGWAKGVVESCGAFDRSEHVHVLPLGVDREIFCEAADADQRADSMVNGHSRPTVFLSVGKWERRKGHDLLLEAFNNAFVVSDDVELWMLAFNPVIADDRAKTIAKNQEWETLYRSSRLGAKIRFLPRMAERREVAAAMRQADCGVFLSRAEGWNLPALEMMSCGKPLIITNYSAHTEYCNPGNAMLIEIDALEDARDERWFSGQGQWAALGPTQLEQTIAFMRQVHARKQAGESLLNSAGIETARRFTWNDTAAAILNVV